VALPRFDIERGVHFSKVRVSLTSLSPFTLHLENSFYHYKTTGYIIYLFNTFNKFNRERSGPESWPVPVFNTPLHTGQYQLC